MTAGGAVTWTSAVGYIVLGGVIGALGYPALVWVGIALNLKGLRTLYTGFKKDRAFYRSWAWLGGAMGMTWVAAMIVMDAYGVKDPWYGLALIAIGLLLLWQQVRVLKRLRAGNAAVGASGNSTGGDADRISRSGESRT